MSFMRPINRQAMPAEYHTTVAPQGPPQTYGGTVTYGQSPPAQGTSGTVTYNNQPPPSNEYHTTVAPQQGAGMMGSRYRPLNAGVSRGPLPGAMPQQQSAAMPPTSSGSGMLGSGSAFMRSRYSQPNPQVPQFNPSDYERQ